MARAHCRGWQPILRRRAAPRNIPCAWDKLRPCDRKPFEQRREAQRKRNAAKFTKNGTVAFAARTAPGIVVVSIKDTGVGIVENRIGRLFETFGNSEDETSSNYGADVRSGLPLAQRYCRLMGRDRFAADWAPDRSSPFSCRSNRSPASLCGS